MSGAASDATQAEAAVAPFDRAEYEAFLGSIALETVETIHVEATRAGGDQPHRNESGIEQSFVVDEDQQAVFYRYDVAVQSFSESGDEVATIEAVLVFVYSTELVPGVDPAVVEHFGRTSGYLMAHPYLREAVSALALRVGVPGVYLPLVRGR